jgi:protein gp37
VTRCIQIGTTKIEWTEATWNPIVGCTIVSPGCTNCYAMRTAARLSNNPATPQYRGTIQPSRAGPVWTGKVSLAEKAPVGMTGRTVAEVCASAKKPPVACWTGASGRKCRDEQD